MLFTISRTSRTCYERPCKNAFLTDEDDVWFIELDETKLLDFSKKYGNIIIRTNEVIPSIEIYDNYRE